MLKGEEVIGALSFIEDSPIGIPIDFAFPDQTALLRQLKVKFAEAGTFAITPEYQHYGIVMLLFKAVFLYSYLYRNIESLLITVNPRSVRFYKKLFDFVQVGDAKVNPRLNNEKSLLLKVNAAEAVKSINNNDIFNAIDKNLKIDYRLSWRNNTNAMPGSESFDDINYLPVWRDSHIQKYFEECRMTLNHLPQNQREMISWLYPTLT